MTQRKTQLQFTPILLIIISLLTTGTWVPGSEKSGAKVNSTSPQIAFLSDRDHPGNAEIYVMQEDGGNQTRLTTNLGLTGFTPGTISGLDGRFDWNPVQRRYFVSTTSGALYSVADDGTDKRLIAQDVHLFDISPDGQWIALYKSTGAPTYGDIATMRIDGTDLTVITGVSTRTSLGLPPSSPFLGPAWSPDGQSIAFYGYLSLFAINRDGSNPAFVSSAQRCHRRAEARLVTRRSKNRLSSDCAQLPTIRFAHVRNHKRR